MTDNTIREERQLLMQGFLQAKAELRKVRAENASLKQKNEKLELEVEELEMQYTNLFSAVQEK